MGVIDIESPEGLKHYVLLYTMYETAARVSEAVDMDIQNFSFGKENYVIICGKGSKYRRVYLNEKTSGLIQNFCKKSLIEEGPLFRNRSGKRISDSGFF